MGYGFNDGGDHFSDRDYQTKPPNDFGDDISTELAIKLTDAEEQNDQLRARIAELEAEVERLRKALESIKHHSIPMTARDEYRRGFADALEATRNIAKSALEASDEV